MTTKQTKQARLEDVRDAAAAQWPDCYVLVEAMVTTFSAGRARVAVLRLHGDSYQHVATIDRDADTTEAAIDAALAAVRAREWAGQAPAIDDGPHWIMEVA